MAGPNDPEYPTTPAAAAGLESLFRWETLKEIGPHFLGYKSSVPGKALEVELTSGHKIHVWRAESGSQYFCHGLTFGGKAAPGGPVSPFTGKPVETILHGHYQLIPEAQARPGDILVWWGIAPDTTPHSAILAELVFAPGKGYFHESTKVRSKNGMMPEADVSLADLFLEYGESYNVYRRR
jgi:hypothetical protein